ncbi:NlpC/P60 family protein [Desulfovibrio sp. OttesenSCG-928-M14]|nr:NlpC/P60 family protein [Desulfovibrio sp. OttesenSCG-928-M14]
MHTGIYTGNGKFVHSPSSGKSVRVENLNNSYWRNKFIAGRRVRQVH